MSGSNNSPDDTSISEVQIDMDEEDLKSSLVDLNFFVTAAASGDRSAVSSQRNNSTTAAATAGATLSSKNSLRTDAKESHVDSSSPSSNSPQVLSYNTRTSLRSRSGASSDKGPSLTPLSLLNSNVILAAPPSASIQEQSFDFLQQQLLQEQETEMAKTYARKINVLKRAIFEEKKRRLMEREKMSDALKQVEILQKQLNDKDKHLAKVIAEKLQLEERYDELKDDQIMSEFDLSSDKTDNKANNKKKGQHQMLESAEIKAYQREIKQLRFKCDQLESQLAAKDQALTETRLLHETKINILQSQMSVKDQHFKELNHRLQVVDEENKKLHEMNNKLAEEKRQQEIDIKMLQSRLEQANANIELVQDQLAQKEADIDRLKFQLEERVNSCETLADKLIELKAHIDCLSLQLRKFQMKRLSKMLPKTETEIVLSKNPSNGLLIVDIYANKKHTVHPISHLLEVQPDPSNEKRFFMQFIHGELEVYETDERDEFLECIRDFLRVHYEENIDSAPARLGLSSNGESTAGSPLLRKKGFSGMGSRKK